MFLDVHLGFWGLPSWNFAWLALYLERVGFEEYMYQVSCLYHNLNYSCYMLQLSLLSGVCKSAYMLYLKNRNRYKHVLGTEISVMSNFLFNFNIFMGLKTNAS